jgi:plasmid stabilization system protein ParE
MPPQAWSRKRERQYQHIKEGLVDRGDTEWEAEEIAARTVNKSRARSGESAQASRTSLEEHLLIEARRPPLPQGGRRPYPGPTLRGGPSEERQGKVDDVEGAVGTSPESLIMRGPGATARQRAAPGAGLPDYPGRAKIRGARKVMPVTVRQEAPLPRGPTPVHPDRQPPAPRLGTRLTSRRSTWCRPTYLVTGI